MVKKFIVGFDVSQMSQIKKKTANFSDDATRNNGVACQSSMSLSSLGHDT